METVTVYPEKFFWANELLSNVTGLWIYNSDNIPKWRRRLQTVWTFMLYIGATVFLILQFLILKETAKDVNKFFSHIGLLMSNSLGVFKIAPWLLQHNKIRGIIDTFHDKHFQYDSIRGFDPAMIFHQGKKFSQRCTISIISLYTLVGISAHISTAAAIRKAINGTHFENEYSCQDYLPYYFLIPFKANTKDVCDYVLLYMDFSVCIFAWVVGCYDGFFVALLNCLKAHLVILHDAIRLVRKRIYHKLDMDESLEMFHDENYRSFEEELYKEMIRLIRHLATILRTAEMFEEMFNLMIFAQALTSLFNVISCLFNASKVPLGSSVFFASLVYFMSMLLELALVCWFGNEITIESEKIMFALYEIDWYSASRRFKKALILTMCRMQRPIYLTIGKFFPLTLSATVAVCKAAFSYYTVFSRDS